MKVVFIQLTCPVSSIRKNAVLLIEVKHPLVEQEIFLNLFSLSPSKRPPHRESNNSPIGFLGNVVGAVVDIDDPFNT